jgi:hypothetical protein
MSAQGITLDCFWVLSFLSLPAFCQLSSACPPPNQMVNEMTAPMSLFIHLHTSTEVSPGAPRTEALRFFCGLSGPRYYDLKKWQEGIDAPPLED